MRPQVLTGLFFAVFVSPLCWGGTTTIQVQASDYISTALNANLGQNPLAQRALGVSVVFINQSPTNIVGKCGY